MQRMLCAALAALVLSCLSPAAEARGHILYRVKCAGPYCWPVAEPAPPRRRAAHRTAARLQRHVQHTSALAQEHSDVDNDGRWHAASAQSFPSPLWGGDRGGGSREKAQALNDVAERATGSAASAPVSIARRYLGGNPVGWAHVWCGAFMRLVMRAAGYPDLPSGDLAAAWARYGRASVPQPGAVVVWPHHVGLITAVHGNGLATVISGNDGHRVRERVMSIARAVVRLPG
jgi:hypothetical protein